MFAITAKVKIAAGIAAGALTLGAAGAYAATANNTITVDPTKSVSLSNGQTTLKLVALNGATTNLTLPTSFTNLGQCVSWFATKRNYAAAPTSGTTVSKNYHGDRKSTRLNSSHTVISYAVFCLKKKKGWCTSRRKRPRNWTGRRVGINCT